MAIEGKRISKWNKNIVLDDDFEVGVDKLSLTESERTKLSEIREHLNGIDSNKMMFFNRKFINGMRLTDLMNTFSKQFIDYSTFNKEEYNSQHHYRYILFDIIENDIYIAQKMQFNGIDDFFTWLNNNLSLDSGELEEDVRIKIYLIQSLTEKKIINIYAANKAFSRVKSSLANWGEYNDNTIRILRSTSGTWRENLIVDIWNELLAGGNKPLNSNGEEVWLSSVRQNLYNALPVHKYKQGSIFLFHNYESFGRKVWVPDYNGFYDINDIVQNYKDPFWSNLLPNTTHRQRIVSIDNSNNYSILESKYTPIEEYHQQSLVRIYLLTGQFYDGTAERTCYALTVKPIGQDYFSTRYYDNNHELYAYLKSNIGKPIIRKLSVTRTGDEANDIGWTFNKREIYEHITSRKYNNNSLNNNAFKDMYFFVMNENTGKISPLSDMYLSAKTFMRGSSFNLMLRNKV